MTPNDTLRLVRADDQLDVLVELVGLAVDGDALTVVGDAPAIRLRFGSQHTAPRGGERRLTVETDGALTTSTVVAYREVITLPAEW